MDNFYMTVISNNTSDPNNTSSSFRTILPHTLTLDKNWQCALTEISFIRSWNNVDAAPKEHDQTSVRILDSKTMRVYTFKISEGYYEQIDDLLNIINTGFQEHMTARFKKLGEDVKEYESFVASTLEEVSTSVLAYLENMKEEVENEQLIRNSFKISHDSIKKRVYIDLNPKYCNGVRFSDHLFHMLGFKHVGAPLFLKENASQIWADYQVNMNPQNTLYVYADFVQPSIMSNTQARLLRVINGSGRYGDLTTKNFLLPYYLPVALNVINSIEIELKDSMNRLIRFAYGVTVIVLHFKKKKTLLAIE
jgi:hypothetical protein